MGITDLFRTARAQVRNEDTQEGRITALAQGIEGVLGRHGYSYRDDDTSDMDAFTTVYTSKDGSIRIEITPDPEGEI